MDTPKDDGESIEEALGNLRSSIGGGTDLWVLKASESNKGQVKFAKRVMLRVKGLTRRLANILLPP